jgi:hypothetical protein
VVGLWRTARAQLHMHGTYTSPRIAGGRHLQVRRRRCRRSRSTRLRPASCVSSSVLFCSCSFVTLRRCSPPSTGRRGLFVYAHAYPGAEQLRAALSFCTIFFLPFLFKSSEPLRVPPILDRRRRTTCAPSEWTHGNRFGTCLSTHAGPWLHSVRLSVLSQPTLHYT